MFVSKVVRGFRVASGPMTEKPVKIRYTEDKRGKTLSLDCDGVMIIVAYEDVLSLIATCHK